MTNAPFKRSQKPNRKVERIVFQASFFRGELLNFGRVICGFDHIPNIYLPMILVDSLAPIGSTKLAGLGDDPASFVVFGNFSGGNC